MSAFCCVKSDCGTLSRPVARLVSRDRRLHQRRGATSPSGGAPAHGASYRLGSLQRTCRGGATEGSIRPARSRGASMAERGIRRLRLLAALTIAGVTGLAGGALPNVVASDDAPPIVNTDTTTTSCPAP